MILHAAVLVTLIGSNLTAIYVAFNRQPSPVAKCIRCAARALLLFGAILMSIDAAHMFQRGDFVTANEKRLSDANAAMRDRNYLKARDLFAEAESHGADKVACLYGAAECSFYLHEDETAEKLCLDLLGIDGGAAVGRRLRGLIRQRAGNPVAAAHEFQTGARAGDSVSARLLATVWTKP